jgi:lysophospholipase L1-like esterase
MSFRGRRCSLFRLGRLLFTGVVAAYVLVALTLGGSATAWAAFYALTAVWVRLLCFISWERSLEPPAETAKPARVRAFEILEIVGFNLALTLVLAEGLLRSVAAFSGNSLIVSDALDAHRLTPGRDYGGGLHGNSLGYPGPEFRPDKQPGTFRIAVLGDSFAVGTAVPFTDNFLTLVEKWLPATEVYNFGVSGTGPREYRMILNQHVWTMRPDLVVVCLFVGNDITESLATPRHMDPRQHALFLLLARTGRLFHERQRHARQAADSPRQTSAGTFSEETFLEVEGRRLAICLRTQSPDLEKKWQRTLNHIEHILRDCRERPCPATFLLIPDEFQVNPAVLAKAIGIAGVNRTDVDIGLPQRRLNTFFKERGVPCLDLLPAFQKAPDTYALHDTHWNEKGNRLAAEQLSAWLSDLKMGSGSATPPACVLPRPAP